VKRTILALLLSSVTCLAGRDQDIGARIGEWLIRTDTAGTPSGSVVTRVFIERSGASNEAQLELPESAQFIIWTHLAKLPKRRFEYGSFKPPKTDYVALGDEHIHLITDERAFELLRLWLDTHRAEWRAAEPELQTALRTQFFPPKLPKSK
jgi:hypothetical protein